MRILIFLLATLLVFFQYNLWFGKNGYSDFKNTQEKVIKMKQENHQLRTQNQLIFAQIKDLKTGQDAIEEQAREEYDMMKKNEVFYRLVKEK